MKLAIRPLLVCDALCVLRPLFDKAACASARHCHHPQRIAWSCRRSCHTSCTHGAGGSKTKHTRLYEKYLNRN